MYVFGKELEIFKDPSLLIIKRLHEHKNYFDIEKKHM